ncbi:MAG: M28 family metallopeptidase [Chloroflexota bacterium]|nr:M28 family metallopeptidase [Chloroflexota bacterium]
MIADKPGTAGEGRVVVLGGHYDTVPNVPGANDNGSGIATLLTIAREIADREYPFTVRFIAFGAEELGLYGSNYYVDQLSNEEIDSTVAMLNFDALGSGPQTATLGTLSLQRIVEEYAEEQGIDISIGYTMDWGSSDHAAFHEAGIDHIFFLGKDFSRIHTPDDKLEFVETELLGNAAFLGMALLDMLATDEG